MTEATYQTDTITLYHGDSLIVLGDLDDCSIDSIVTDPPYELGFMGKSWDASGIAYNVDLWAECLRVLKPGGHLLAFGGTRTYHRMAVAIEDAGFEIRDSLHWVYGSGFPKSHNVSKAIDKMAGAEREVVGTKLGKPGYSLADNGRTNEVYGNLHDPEAECSITAPATDAAKEWEGWGTALKPAHEPIVLARKTLAGTVAANVLEHGTGALNIDGCRVGSNPGWSYPNGAGGNTFHGQERRTDPEASTAGRWPANIIFDEEAGAELDAQSGIRAPGHTPRRRGNGGISTSGHAGQNDIVEVFTNAGGASRFFYCPKASRAERNAGLDELPELPAGVKNSSGRGFSETDPHKPITAQNHHPTVKPIALMRWLVRLVTPPDGIVLDPFTGSGTTLAAATLEGVNAVGIELTDDYLPIIIGRCEHAAEVRAETVDDDTQLSFDW